MGNPDTRIQIYPSVILALDIEELNRVYEEAKDKLKELQIAIKLKAAATAYASAIDKAYIATTNLLRAAMVALQAYMVICEKGRTKLLFHTMKLCVTAHKKQRTTGRPIRPHPR